MIVILGKGFISYLISSNNRNLHLLSFQKIYNLLGVLWNVCPWSSDCLGYADTLIPDQTPSQGDLLQFRWIRAAKLLILSFETCFKMFFLSLFTVCLRLLPFMMQNSSISLRHLRGVSRDHPRVREIKFPKFVLQNSVLRTNEWSFAHLC